MQANLSVYKIRTTYDIIIGSGGIPKRLKGSVSKTDRWCKLCGGSNPSSSAIIDCRDTYEKVRVFFLFLSIICYIWSCEYNFNQFVTGHIKPHEKSGRTRGLNYFFLFLSIAHLGQPVWRLILEANVACHSWPCPQIHHTFLCEPPIPPTCDGMSHHFFHNSILFHDLVTTKVKKKDPPLSESYSILP